MEFRKHILLKMILPLLIVVPSAIWFRLTPATYEKTVKVTEVIPQETLLKSKQKVDIDKEYYTEETMLVKKERTWIPFYARTVDTIQTTGKQGWSKSRE